MSVAGAVGGVDGVDGMLQGKDGACWIHQLQYR